MEPSCRVPQEAPAGIADLITACGERNPRARPTAAEIVALLAGSEGALQAARPRHPTTDSVAGDAVEVRHRSQGCRHAQSL